MDQHHRIARSFVIVTGTHAVDVDKPGSEAAIFAVGTDIGRRALDCEFGTRMANQDQCHGGKKPSSVGFLGVNGVVGKIDFANPHCYYLSSYAEGRAASARFADAREKLFGKRIACQAVISARGRKLYYPRNWITAKTAKAQGDEVGSRASNILIVGLLLSGLACGLRTTAAAGSK
ncbi:MAG: hypothetical protein ACE5OQ_04900 [Woeseia sp.]